MVNMISRMASRHAAAARTPMSRASSLDVMKCIAAFGVVWIHYGSGWLSPLTRCSVPLFFLITGYYYPVMVGSGRFWGHVRKLLVMVLCASAFYGTVSALVQWHHGTLQEWIAHTFDAHAPARLLLLNIDFFGFHLWYFYAVLYDLILFRLADRWGLTKWLRRACIPLFLVLCVMNFTHFAWLTRNFLFMGLPCMMAGRMVRERSAEAFPHLSCPRLLWPSTIVFLLLCIVEMFVVGRIAGDKGYKDMYIFTLPLLLPWFYCALRHPCFGECTLWAAIGRRYSAYIYIFHTMVSGMFLSHLIDRNANLLTKATYPFLVFGVSLCAAWAFVWLCNRRKTAPRQIKAAGGGQES